MEAATYFFIVLILVYFAECSILTTRGSIVFYSPFLKKWKYRNTKSLFSMVGRYVFWCNPIPPLGLNFLSGGFPIAISPFGILAIENRHDMKKGVTHFSFNDIENITIDDKTVLINGSPFIKAASSQAASFIASACHSLWKTDIVKRESFIVRILENLMNIDQLSNKIVTLKDKIISLRILNIFLFLLLFAALPVLLYSGLLVTIWPIFVLLLFLNILLIIFIYYKVHIHFFKSDRGDRWSNMLAMLFSPPLAIRSIDLLSKNLTAMYHPFALSKILLNPGEHREFITQTMREIVFPFTYLDEHKEIHTWYRKKIVEIVKEKMKNDFNYEDIYKAPVIENSHMQLYCPRCHCQYSNSVSICADCRINLLPF